MSIYTSESELRTFLRTGMARLNSSKEGAGIPDLQDCKGIVEKAAQAAGKLELGGEFILRADEVESNSDARALLANILNALGERSQNRQSQPPSPLPNSDVLTVRQAAQKLGCAERTLYDMVGNNRIKSFRVGTEARGIRFRPEDIDDYMRTNVVEPETGEPDQLPGLTHLRL